jgi:hypothetical protein
LAEVDGGGQAAGCSMEMAAAMEMAGWQLLSVVS